MSIYPMLARADSTFSAAALLFGLTVLVAVGGLDRARGKARVRGGAVALGAGGLVLCASGKVVLAALTVSRFGWAVGGAQLVVTAPVLALPAALMVGTWRRVRGVVRGVRAADGFSPETRARAAAPVVVAGVTTSPSSCRPAR
jgi:hypothetical protein